MTEAATLKRQACDAIDAMSDELISISHEIPANPELSFREHKAAALLSGPVENEGLPVTGEAFGLQTAYSTESGNKVPTVSILSEYDALPGIGHSCGHNIIATTGLGASLALAKLNGPLPGRAR